MDHPLVFKNVTFVLLKNMLKKKNAGVLGAVTAKRWPDTSLDSPLGADRCSCALLVGVVMGHERLTPALKNAYKGLLAGQKSPSAQSCTGVSLSAQRRVMKRQSAATVTVKCDWYSLHSSIFAI